MTAIASGCTSCDALAEARRERREGERGREDVIITARALRDRRLPRLLQRHGPRAGAARASWTRKIGLLAHDARPS